MMTDVMMDQRLAVIASLFMTGYAASMYYFRVPSEQSLASNSTRNLRTTEKKKKHPKMEFLRMGLGSRLSESVLMTIPKD
jgi:hypothetical protein